MSKCKHHTIDKLTKHCANCGKSLVEIDKERDVKEK